MIQRLLTIFKKMKNCTLGVIIYVTFSLFDLSGKDSIWD